jgi:NAD(P)H-dependent flavin oxidoreductase YrpB (nitropropane dioxygenase family)
VSYHRLVAAVSDAGGFGCLGASVMGQEMMVEEIRAVRALTDKPFGVDLLTAAPGDMVRQVQSIIDEGGRVFVAGLGVPLDVITLCHENNVLVVNMCGKVRHAVDAAAAGCDIVVAQGTEAGGHVRATQPLDVALADSLDAVDVPVLAAGGIGTADRLAKVMDAGAHGARVGTRFVAAEESDAHPDWVALLIDASGEDTVLTEAFGVGWPDAPHRVLRSAVEAAEALDGPAGELGGDEIPRFAALPPTRRSTGEIAAMALYAGESAGAVRAIQPASEITAELTAGL